MNPEDSRTTRQQSTEQWYASYYQTKGEHRNDLLRNPEVLFQTLAWDASIIRAVHSTRIDPRGARVLDVGCGAGGSLFSLVRLGFDCSHMIGIDILESRLLEGRRALHGMTFVRDDAASMPFKNGVFDVVFESTMFVQVTDEDLAKTIADEMLRVTRLGGFILLADWRYSRPGNSFFYKGLGTRRIRRLFDVGTRTQLYSVHKGALIPPVGRFLSKYISVLYFVCQSLCPFLVGQRTTVLQKVPVGSNENS